MTVKDEKKITGVEKFSKVYLWIKSNFTVNIKYWWATQFQYFLKLGTTSNQKQSLNNLPMTLALSTEVSSWRLRKSKLKSSFPKIQLFPPG